MPTYLPPKGHCLTLRLPLLELLVRRIRRTVACHGIGRVGDGLPGAHVRWDRVLALEALVERFDIETFSDFSAK